MRSAVIVDVVRSPFVRARRHSAFDGLHPVDLYAQVIEALIDRSGIDPALVEDVITGCVLQIGEQSGNIGRHAALAAGLPVDVPGITIDRKCGSAQQAVDFAAQGIIAGAYDVVIAGGVEMMSLVPMKSNRAGRDPHGRMLKARFPDGIPNQGIAAELIAARFDISREALDAFSLRSHRRAQGAAEAGRTGRDIVPIHMPPEAKGQSVVAEDDGVRKDTSSEKLASLQPAFFDERAQTQYPQIGWRVTAGNSSQVTDGSAAMLVMEEAAARRHGLTPRARVAGFAVVGDDPIMMLTGVIPATRKLLARTGYGLGDIDAFEINEAFASVVLAWQKEIGADPEKVNLDGGAIALGHPVGASGGRLLANLLSSLENGEGRLGIQAMCESGGMANATLFERMA